MNQFFDPQKEMTTPSPSIGVDGEQSIHNNMDIVPQAEEKSNIKTAKSMVENIVKMAEANPYPREEEYHIPLLSATMPELYEMIFPPQLAIVDHFLYPGTYILAGSPKVGKSFFVAQLAYHVSCGLPFFQRKVNQGEVLYFGLEDNYQRLQRRLFSMYGTECSEKLHLSVDCMHMETGLFDQMTGFLKRFPKTKLIIIDTFQKVIQNCQEVVSYGRDYQTMGYFKDFADKHQLSLLLVHHTRKQKSEDSFEMISGTTGIFGSVDGSLLLRKKARSSNEAFLEITGRDVPDQKFFVQRSETGIWQYIKEESPFVEPPLDPIVHLMGKFIHENNANWQGTPTELVKCLNLEMIPQKLTYSLNVNLGVLLEKMKIHYSNQKKGNIRMITLTYIG
ncbi:MAG: AAA family ATPase [Eubacteriales bacterium]